MYGDASTLSLGPTCPRGRPPGEFPSSPYYQVTVTAGPVHQRHSHYSPPYPTPPVVSPRPNYPVHESGYYHPHYYDDPHYIHFGDTRSDCDADAYHKHVPGLYHHEQSVAAPVCSRTWDNHRPTASLCHCGRKDCPTGPSSPCTYGYGDRGAPHQTPPTVRPGYFTPNYHHCEKRPAWRPSPGSLPEAQYETTDARDRGDSCWHHLHGGSRGMPRPCACSDEPFPRRPIRAISDSVVASLPYGGHASHGNTKPSKLSNGRHHPYDDSNRLPAHPRPRSPPQKSHSFPGPLYSSQPIPGKIQLPVPTPTPSKTLPPLMEALRLTGSEPFVSLALPEIAPPSAKEKERVSEQEQQNKVPSSSSLKRYQCPVCLKRFARPSSLQTHTYVHTGERPFSCTMASCGKSFSVLSNLRRHVRVCGKMRQRKLNNQATGLHLLASAAEVGTGRAREVASQTVEELHDDHASQSADGNDRQSPTRSEAEAEDTEDSDSETGSVGSDSESLSVKQDLIPTSSSPTSHDKEWRPPCR